MFRFLKVKKNQFWKVLVYIMSTMMSMSIGETETWLFSSVYGNVDIYTFLVSRIVAWKKVCWFAMVDPQITSKALVTIKIQGTLGLRREYIYMYV